MKLCPCERYRQLNSVLYPNNHILKSSKSLKTFVSKYVNQGCVVFSSKFNTDSFIRSIFIMYANSLKCFFLLKFINFKRKGNFKEKVVASFVLSLVTYLRMLNVELSEHLSYILSLYSFNSLFNSLFILQHRIFSLNVSKKKMNFVLPLVIIF